MTFIVDPVLSGCLVCSIAKQSVKLGFIFHQVPHVKVCDSERECGARCGSNVV